MNKIVEEYSKKLKELLTAVPTKSWDKFLYWWMLYSLHTNIHTKILKGTIPGNMKGVLQNAVQIQAANYGSGSSGSRSCSNPASAAEGKSSQRMIKQSVQKVQDT